MTVPVQPPQAPQPAAQSRNSLGTAGFVLGLIGFVLAFIPLVGVVAWPLVILGLIFALLGFVRVRGGKADNKGISIAGIVLSAIGLLVCILWTVAFGQAAKDVNTESNRVASIDYEVTGDASDATVSYSTFSSKTDDTGQEDITKLPWTKQVKADGFGKSGMLTVTTGMNGGSVTCKVTVNGKVAKTATAKGKFAVASCDYFG